MGNVPVPLTANVSGLREQWGNRTERIPEPERPNRSRDNRREEIRADAIVQIPAEVSSHLGNLRGGVHVSHAAESDPSSRRRIWSFEPVSPVQDRKVWR